MRVRLSVQPYADEPGLLDVVGQALREPALRRFNVVVAWATFRGLDRIRNGMEDLRARGGQSLLIVGIDEGGATVQGLRLAHDLFDDVHVFFTEDERTFHPKLYVVRGDDEARIFIGSNNLTPGGTFFNYELGVELTVQRENEDPDGVAFLDEVDRYIAGLYADVEVCKPLAEILDELLSDPKYRIRDERRPRRAAKPEAGEEAPDPTELARKLFGRSARAMRSTPPGAVPPADERPMPEEPATPTQEEEAAVQPTAAVVRRWYRRLDATQAQHPPRAESNVTGNLKLSKAGHDEVDQKTYFRQEFFGDADWESEATPRGPHETAAVTFQVIVGGNDLGPMDLQVSHADYRIAAQNNVPTWLHWGRTKLMPVLRQTNYTGQWVTLEHLDDGSHRLTIESAPTGSFME